MKLAYVLAASAALVLTPVANAQVTCAQVSLLTDAATEQFGSVSGDDVSDSVYEATFLLDGASLCQVTSDFSDGYSCSWVYDNLQQAQASYGLQSHALAGCLGDWEREPYTLDSGLDGAKTLDGASYFSEADDGGEFTWIAFLEEHIEGDTHDWHVWVGLDYF